MCETKLHSDWDNVLLEVRPEDLTCPAVFDMIRDHRYGDECCTLIEGDMHVRLKKPWLTHRGGVSRERARGWLDHFITRERAKANA